MEQTIQAYKSAKLVNILFAVYILAIVTLLIIPTGGAIRLDKYFLGIRTDKLIHASMFFPFIGYIWIRNLHHGKFISFLTLYVAGILFAGFCESLHYFIKYRSFDVTDFYANVTGLTLGNLIFLFRSPRLGER